MPVSNAGIYILGFRLRGVLVVKPASLNECFKRWAQSLTGGGLKGYTISYDGKTIRPTEKMGSYTGPPHIISAQLTERGITIGQKTVDGKSNEIPAMREPVVDLDIQGSVIVADALNCRKETAKTIRADKGDSVLSVKDNRQTLKEDIAGYIQDEPLRKTMDTIQR